MLPAVNGHIWRGFLFLQDVGTVETLDRALTAEARARLRNTSFTLVASSRFLRTAMAERLNLFAEVVYPLVDMCSAPAVVDVNAPVTMFGTTPEKGLDVFEEIARRMPSHLFRAVAGWNESSNHFRNTHATLFDEGIVVQVDPEKVKEMISQKVAEKDQAWFDWQEITSKPRGTKPTFYTWTEKGRRHYEKP